MTTEQQFAVYTDDAIWGVGSSILSAKRDADDWLGEPAELKWAYISPAALSLVESGGMAVHFHGLDMVYHHNGEVTIIAESEAK